MLLFLNWMNDTLHIHPLWLFLIIPALIGAGSVIIPGLFDYLYTKSPPRWEIEAQKHREQNRVNVLFQDMLGARLFLDHPMNKYRVEILLENGAFDLGGIQTNDYIISINGEEINSLEDLENLKLESNQVINLIVNRAGVDHSIKLSLIETKKNGFPITQLIGASAFKQLVSLRGTEYCFAYDTNILIKYPFLFSDYANSNTLLLSKQVFKELDRKKTDPDIGQNVRNAMIAIETAQMGGGLAEFLSVDNKYIQSKNLNPTSPDECIIASYIFEKEVNNREIIFISEDRGARIIARESGLEVLNWGA